MEELKYKIGDRVNYLKEDCIIVAIRPKSEKTHPYVVTYSKGWNNNTSSAYTYAVIEGKLLPDTNYHFVEERRLTPILSQIVTNYSIY